MRIFTTNDTETRLKECQILDESYYLRESDIVEENQGEDFYFWLNPDGSLPFPGTRGIIISFVSSVRSSNVYPGLLHTHIPSSSHFFQIFQILQILNGLKDPTCAIFLKSW